MASCPSAWMSAVTVTGSPATRLMGKRPQSTWGSTASITTRAGSWESRAGVDWSRRVTGFRARLAILITARGAPPPALSLAGGAVAPLPSRSSLGPRALLTARGASPPALSLALGPQSAITNPQSVDAHRPPILDAAQVLLAAIQLEDGHGSRQQFVTAARAQAARRSPGIGRVDERFPPLLGAHHRQRERNRLIAGIQEQQKRVADDPATALVDFVDSVTVEADTETAHIGRTPSLVHHLASRRIEPGDVEHVGS